MDPTLLRALALIVVLLLATAAGLTLRRRSGRAREVREGQVLTGDELGGPLGERATFVQFSSPACSPCRAVHRVLAGVVAREPQLGHLDVDATQHLDLTRRLDIMRTPTVLVLDREGLVIRRIWGVLTAEQALAAVPDTIRS